MTHDIHSTHPTMSANPTQATPRRRPGARRRLRLALLAALALPASLPWTPAAVAQPRFSFATAPGALSKSVVPLRYALAFDLDPAQPRFSAQTTITLRVDQPVPALVLHAHELEAGAASLQAAGAPPQPLRVSTGKLPQTWQLDTPDGAPLAAGEYTLRIDYRGQVQRSGQGLYGVDHTVRGEKQRMLATQLQAVFARTVFPCFDEPAFRAVFEISVKAPPGYTVLSNMPALSPEPVTAGPPGVAGTQHRFAPTPPMPSYLVALAVGRFDELSGSAAGVPLRIFTAPGKREQARFAMNATEQVVPYFNDYFGVPYALPKLDQLAVAGVRDGAMEDWGLISYAEPAILFDPARSSPLTQRWAYDTIAHEIAHQWFGNLVTAASWDEIWLNEAFATWLAGKATARFNPSWNTALHRRKGIDRAMARDATTATRAIRSGPVRESAVFDVFDNITYTKGGAVLSMLEQWIGPDAFRRGLAAYMQGQRLSNATAGDLWFHMGHASGQPVAAVAASWTDQRGFPLVTVASRCRAGRTEVTLTQQRFWTGAGTRERTLWKIPVTLSRGAQQAQTLMEGERARVQFEGCGPEPVLANAGGAGFYRVAYAPADQRRAAASFASLPAADRVALLSDTTALVLAGRLPLPAYIDLLDTLPAVQDASRGTLYGMAIESLQFFDKALHGTPAQARLRAAGRGWLAPALQALGWQPHAGEPHDDTVLRGELIAQLARFDHAETLRRARDAFDADAASQAPLPASIREAVLVAVGVQADRARFDRLRAALLAASGEEDRWILAGALAHTRDPALADELLQLTLSGTLPNNIASELPGILSHRSPFAERAYRFVLAHWDALATQAGGMFGARESLLPQAAAGFNRVADARRLEADQRERTGRDGEASAARVARRIEIVARVRERDADALSRLLAAR